MVTGKKATISFSDGTTPVEFPIFDGSIGPDVIDIRKLYSSTGKFMYDPGFLSTASCQSKITYIDGAKGILLYRGYPIEQLAINCDFLEVCYLLYYGELPSQKEKINFENEVKKHAMVHESIFQLISGFPRSSHPMAILTSISGAMAGLYPESLEVNNTDQQELSLIRLIAKMPTLVAMTYKHTQGKPFTYPINDLSYSSNFMRMMFGTPQENYQEKKILARALDRIFILHADHEQNASTSTVRLCGSSGTSPYTAISSGVACLWGPAHGGANQACLEMLENLYANGGLAKVGEFMEKVKDKESNVRLMGFGHRVYKNFDPRAKIMQETCRQVLAELGLENDPLFKLALAVEKIALEDPYFVERKLYPNVDFYSGITLKALGVTNEMFTCIFALARTIGWISQWREMITDNEYKIGRPRQLFVGSSLREVKSLKSR